MILKINKNNYWAEDACHLSCYLFSQINMLAKTCFKNKCLVFNRTTVSVKKKKDFIEQKSPPSITIWDEKKSNHMT